MAAPVPSLPETMTALKDVLTIVSEGGQKAIIFIVIINVVLALVGFYFGIRWFLAFLQATNDRIEKITAQKDELLNNSRKRSEEQNVQYAELLTKFLERENKNMAEIHELKAFLTNFVLSGHRK